MCELTELIKCVQSVIHITLRAATEHRGRKSLGSARAVEGAPLCSTGSPGPAEDREHARLILADRIDDDCSGGCRWDEGGRNRAPPDAPHAHSSVRS